MQIDYSLALGGTACCLFALIFMTTVWILLISISATISFRSWAFLWQYKHVVLLYTGVSQVGLSFQVPTIHLLLE